MSPILIQMRAKYIMQRRLFCLYHDPRFEQDGIARRGDGCSTAPENIPAVMFTLTGAVARAVFELTGEPWTARDEDYCNAMMPLWSRVSFNHAKFLRLCDQMGKEKCIKLLEEVLAI